ncbi:hypothetical protein [Corynebacterium coyleae]|uniref:hypothetical protein n=1 Tax=Corynebacterium coyleae TaxID=53374 RepID=UPI00254BE5B1|nr:hypothetical protein [Corynebacterium coyleae]MDK8241671.1 hypothetical protein [Corynebacterium coyleae]
MPTHTALSPQDMLTEVCDAVLEHKLYKESALFHQAARARIDYQRIPRQQRAHLRTAERYAFAGDRYNYALELEKIKTAK